jgi:hypothetical protein
VIRVLAAAALGAGMLPLGACNIVAPIGYLVHGPEKVPAAFDLDPKKSTVVFIDDSRASVLPSRAARRKIGETAESVLLNDADIEKVIASQDVMAVADREKYSKQMGIVELGEAVGADVIIYVTMETFEIVQEEANFTPKATGRIRVVDVKEKKQIFPGELAKTHLLEVTAPPRTSALPSNTSERAKVQLELAERFGRALGNVFVRHEKRPQTGRLDH